jgi:hypothetical protein
MLGPSMEKSRRKAQGEGLKVKPRTLNAARQLLYPRPQQQKKGMMPKGKTEKAIYPPKPGGILPFLTF